MTKFRKAQRPAATGARPERSAKSDRERVRGSRRPARRRGTAAVCPRLVGVLRAEVRGQPGGPYPSAGNRVAGRKGAGGAEDV